MLWEYFLFELGQLLLAALQREEVVNIIVNVRLQTKERQLKTVGIERWRFGGAGKFEVAQRQHPGMTFRAQNQVVVGVVLSRMRIGGSGAHFKKLESCSSLVRQNAKTHLGEMLVGGEYFRKVVFLHHDARNAIDQSPFLVATLAKQFKRRAVETLRKRHDFYIGIGFH